MNSKPVSLAAYRRLLRENPNFRRLWRAQIVSEIGDWFYSLAIYTLVFELSGKAQSIGLVLIFQVLPQVFIAPAAGIINDRLSRKRVMIAADLARAAIVSGMLLVRTPQTIWLVYPLLLLETLMWGFFEPAHTAVIPNVTAVEDVMLANTLSATTWSFDFAIGFTLGGLVATLFGRDTVFVMNALSFLVSAFLIGRMHFLEPHAAHAAPLRWRDLTDYSPVLDGVRYIRHDARLLVTVMLKGGVGMLGANWVILPIMGDRVFPIKAQTLGAQRGALLGMSVLMGARGAGALIGPYFSARWAAGREPAMRRAILIAFLLAAAGYAGLAAAPNIWLACAAVVLAHGAGSVIWVFSTTLLQLHTDDRFRGRVFSADLSFCMIGIAVTGYLASVAFDTGVPIRFIALAAGVAMLLPAIAWACALRLWRN